APWIAAPSSVRGTDCGRRATGNSGGGPCPLTTTVYWRGCGWTPCGGEEPLDLPVVPVRPTGSGCTPSPGWSGSASPTASSPTGSTLGTARGSTPTHSRTLIHAP